MDRNITISQHLPSTQTVKRALIAGIPYIGGSLDHLLFDRAEEIFMQNLDNAVQQISNRLEKLEERQINKQWFESEEALSLFRSLLDKVGYDNAPEKLQTLSQLYALFGTEQHYKDPNKYAVIEVVSKLTYNQLLVFQTINRVPATKKDFDSDALHFSATARWQSAILDFMQNDTQLKDQIHETY